MPWRTLLCIGLAAAVIVLSLRLAMLHRTIEELREQLGEILSSEETNALLTVSTADRPMRRLAADLNGHLRLLQAQRWRYQQGDAELKEAVANISHDLRTPLTAICGYLELLQEEALPPAAQRYVGLIRNRADAMKQLTEELFCYSVITAASGPPADLSLAQVSLNSILEESLAAYYGLFTRQGILPQIALPEQPVMRCLEKAAVSRIFGNILSNAAKYSEGDLQVILFEDGTVCFSNTARGLSAVAVEKLFDRFYTVESGRSSTGLGLSIAKTLTEQMNGKIQAQYCDKTLSITVQFPESIR